MSSLKYLKIIAFLIVINSCSTSSLHKNGINIKEVCPIECEVEITNTKDLKFEKLEACLLKAGVKNENIIHRDHKNKYNELNWQWNFLNGCVQPMAYLLADKVSDVQNAVICSRSSNIRIVARSGGESYVKNGFGDSNSLVVDLARLNEISLNSMRMECSIGAGARISLINPTLAESKFLIPVGICPTLGVAGLALGGGWGYFTRQYGLTTDSIIELEMVDAKGNLLTINNSTNNDLFYALRGAGAGSYGIVTKFKFAMYPAPINILYGVYEFDFQTNFVHFYEAWQSLITRLPNNVGTMFAIRKEADNIGKLIKMRIYDINLTKRAKSTRNISDFLISFPNATKTSTKVISYPEFLLMVTQSYSSTNLTNLSQIANIRRTITIGWKKVKSFYVNKILNVKEINELYHLLDEYLEFANLSFLQNGGAYNKFSSSETAFVHRSNLYDVQMQLFNREGEDSEADSAAKKFYEKSKEVFNHRQSYQNYLDQDIPDYLNRYYAENLEKLKKIKTRIDPSNVFHHPQSIPPSSANFGKVV